MPVGNNTDLITQIIQSSKLQGKALEDLKSHLAQLSEAELQAELTKALSGDNSYGDMGLKVEYSYKPNSFNTVLLTNSHKTANLTEDQAKDLSIDYISSNLQKALEITMHTNNGWISKAYDFGKNLFNTELSSKNVNDVVNKEHDCISYLIKSKEGKLTKREYYEMNKARLKEMFLNRMKNQDDTGLDAIDKYREEYSRKEFEELIDKYLTQTIDTISTMEGIKLSQHQLITATEEVEAELLEKIATEAKKNKGIVPSKSSDISNFVDIKNNPADFHPFNSDELMTFEETYLLERGVEFSVEEMEELQQAQGEMTFVTSAYNKLLGLKNSVENFKTSYEKATQEYYDEYGVVIVKGEEPNAEERKKEALDILNNYYQLNPEMAIDDLQNIINKQFLNLKLSLNEEGQLELNFNEFHQNDVSKNKSLNLLMHGLNQHQVNRFNNLLSNKTIDEYISDFQKEYSEALGERNVEELAKAMEKDNIEFIDTTTGVASAAGMGLLLVGGVFVAAPVVLGSLGVAVPATLSTGVIATGANLATAVGGKIAIGGMATRNILGITEAYSREEKSQEEITRRYKDLAMDVSGFIIGSFAGATGFKSGMKAFQKGAVNKLGAKAMEASIDASISVAGDLAMIGILDYDQDLKTTIKQNGIGILISTLTGIKTGQVYEKHNMAKAGVDNVKVKTIDVLVKEISNNKEEVLQLKNLLKEEPKFVEELIRMDKRFTFSDINFLAKSYKKNPEFTKLIVESQELGKYRFNDMSYIANLLNMKPAEIDYIKEVINMKNTDGSYRFKEYEINNFIRFIEKDFDTFKFIIESKSTNGLYKYDAYCIYQLLDIKTKNIDLYKMLMNETDVSELDSSIISYSVLIYEKFPERFEKIIKAKDKNGKLVFNKDNDLYTNSLVYDLSDDVFNKIYKNVELMSLFKKLNDIYHFNFEDSLREGFDRKIIAKLFDEYKDNLDEKVLLKEGYRRITESVVRDYIKNDYDTETIEVDYKILNDYLKNAEVSDMEEILASKYPMNYIKNNIDSTLIKNIEQTRSFVKNEKILSIVDDYLKSYKEENKKSYLVQAQKIIDMYNSVEQNYMSIDKNLMFRNLLSYAKKNKPEIYEVLVNCENPEMRPEYKILKKDFMEEMKYAELIDFCKSLTSENSKIANVLYSELYLKSTSVPRYLKDELAEINKKYGIKIFLSKEIPFGLFETTDFIHDEISKWQIASGGEAKMPPVIDLLTSKRDYIDEESAYGSGTAAGFSESSTNGAVSINGNGYERIEYALRHEIMHTNDKKRLMSFPDDEGYVNKTKYRDEFIKIGIKEWHIDYAYNNPEEFIAVAAEGDLSKCSNEFRQVLIDFGMPKWVFKLDNVDINDIKMGYSNPNKKINSNHWVSYNKFYESDIDNAVDDIILHYTKAEPEIREIINSFGFEDLGKFSARIKSDYSLRDKIKNFLKDHPSATHKDVWDEIRDCFGMRSIVKSEDYTTHPEVKKLIDAGDIKGAKIKAAELQSEPAVAKVKEIILANKKGDNRITVARITNYVSKDGIPYFSEAQLAELKQFGFDNGVEIDYVKKAAPDDIKAGEMDFDAKPTTRSQPSGYTALQMNFVTKNGDTIEWQYRGEEVNRFAEGEHIPYDLRTGKDITGGNKDLEVFYSDFKSMLINMGKDEYKAYNAYLDAHYTHLRNLELGFESTPPKLQDFAPKGYTFSHKLEAENLIKLSKIAHYLKNGKITLEIALGQYYNI